MAGGAELPCRAARGGILLTVRVTPKASSDTVVGCERRAEGVVLAVKVRALPDKGEANDAVVAVLAKWLSEPKARLKVAAGAKARLKQVFVAGEPAELIERIAVRLCAKE
jgi:uncharacterized protein YggU (UPF0235/DUF167 family)